MGTNSDDRSKKPIPGLDTEVQFLKGIGPKGAMVLAKLGLKTVGDVLWYLPRRYEDRRNLPPISLLRPGVASTIRGRLTSVDTRGTRGGKVMITATVEDHSGAVGLVWFNQPWVVRDLQKVDGEILAFGMVKEGSRGRLEISSPEWEAIDEEDDHDDFARLIPVYGLSEGVPQRLVRKACLSAIEHFLDRIEDPLPSEFRTANHLKPLAWCLRQMHLPQSIEDRDDARRRLVFEEFFYLQLLMQLRRQQVAQEVGVSFPISTLRGAGASSTSLFGEATDDDLWTQVHKMLPFELTGAQTRVIGEIWNDMENPAPMNRLVQGDVGSGKTAVAACAMLAAVRCGYQAAMMAPTEILAEQHYANLVRLFDPLGITVKLLVGKQSAQVKRAAVQAAGNGEAQICVGTHALIQEGVKFAKLGLAVIDEQHRFGVVQRLALRQKGVANPDVLVMTATPIPRTLTMTLYGDLDLSVIDELPPGRKPIKTHWRLPHDRPAVYEAVKKLLDEGRQAYFVCPMITENDKLQVQAAEDLYYRLSEGPFKDRRVGLLHGQMKGAEKEDVMNRFRKHELDVLVATVVIEVGVDVPNSNVMVIEDANRFGLSQLHQLRGRVGRGSYQSFCILIADSKGEVGDARMKIMVETTDGFKIAEEDLKLRGPGDLTGTRQSGELEFKIANLIDDGPQLERAKQAAVRYLQGDRSLSQPESQKILEKVKEQRSFDALVVVS